MNALKLLWVFFRIGLMNELAYRANFYVQFLQSLMKLGVALASLSVVFNHADTLNGWKPAELVALLGVFFLMSGVIGTLIQPSMQRFMEDVRQGTLDFSLTKPEDAQVLVSISEVRVWQLVDIVQGIVVLCIALWQIGGDIGDFVLNIGQHGAGTVFDQRLGTGQPDALRASGDQGDGVIGHGSLACSANAPNGRAFIRPSMTRS